ncbi:MAG: LPS export ABC transporter ATP-binding protein [Bdellovibrionaceae bacterium]|nr:LPS export ABC transporter ATP-binding protein [Pseudobdellovibrionaceae bacterium]
MSARLHVRDIAKTFKGRRVVNQVSFDIEAGQVVGLLGPNGAGKTTSFYMVVGLVSPDEGDILLNDLSIRNMPMFQRARVGLSYLPQEASIFRRLTVSENIIVALEAHGISGSAKEERLEHLLDDFSVRHIRDSYGYALSGGERRRVEIARALAGDPKFILLDEPFAGIDPIAVADIQNIILELKKRGIGVLITDHNVRETLGICDFAYIMKDGQVQVSGPSMEVANSELARKFYLGENFKL